MYDDAGDIRGVVPGASLVPELAGPERIAASQWPPSVEEEEEEEATGWRGFLKKYGPELLIGGGMLGGSLFGRDRFQVNRPNRPFPTRAAAGAIVDTNGSPLEALVAEAGEREFVGDFPAVRDQLGLERHEISRVLGMPQLQGGGVATDEEILMGAYPDMRPGAPSDDEIMAELLGGGGPQPGPPSDDEIMAELLGGGDPQEEEDAMLKQLLKQQEPASLLEILRSILKDTVINSIDDPNRQGKNSFVPAMLKAYDEINKFKGAGMPQFQAGAQVTGANPNFVDPDKQAQILDKQSQPGYFENLQGPQRTYGARQTRTGTPGSGGLGGTYTGDLQEDLFVPEVPAIGPISYNVTNQPDADTDTGIGTKPVNNFNARNIAQNISSAYSNMAAARGQTGRFNRAGQVDDRFDRGVQGAFADRALQEAASNRADYGADLQGWQAQDASDRGWANLGLGAEQARGPGVWQNMANLGMSYLAGRN
jgi:hypothetical protein